MAHKKVCRHVFAAIAWFLIAVGGIRAANLVDKCQECVCDGEEDAFKLFIKGAGKLDPDYTPPADLDSVSHTTADGKKLVGYMAKARNNTRLLTEPEGYILLLPGNAIIAQRVVSDIRALSVLGYDVYVYDYRGYGRSPGPPTVKGIISDAEELIADLNRPRTQGGRGYKKHVIYGISAGGAIALNAIDANAKIDRLILDGLPATISVKVRILFWHDTILDCPPELAPMNRPLFDSKRTLLIRGDRDNVLRNTQDQRDQDTLLAKMSAAGVCVSVQPKFGHPLKDGLTSKRIELIDKFLAADLTNGCPRLPIY